MPVAGGLPQPMPLDRGGFMSFSPDGKHIAYNRIFRNFRTWKRYDGGLAQDVYIYNFDTRKLKHVTDWKGTETSPMWYGQHDLLPRPTTTPTGARTSGLHDLATGDFREVTHFTRLRHRFPEPRRRCRRRAGIVFQQGGTLYVLDLPSEQLHD